MSSIDDVENKLANNFSIRAVTGIFEHYSDKVLKVKFEGGDSLEVTESHPIYSKTAQKWQLAGDLKIGEEVLTYQGSSKVASKERLLGTHKVYNLEVKDLHNFLAGDVGVVVHNGCVDDIFRTLSQAAGQHTTRALNKLMSHKVAAKALGLSGKKIDDFANLVEAKALAGLKNLGFDDVKIEANVIFVTKGNIRYRAPKLKDNGILTGNIEYKPSTISWNDVDTRPVLRGQVANNHIEIFE